jgi:hypothetical protein
MWVFKMTNRFDIYFLIPKQFVMQSKRGGMKPYVSEER